MKDSAFKRDCLKLVSRAGIDEKEFTDWIKKYAGWMRLYVSMNKQQNKSQAEMAVQAFQTWKKTNN